MTNPPPSKLVFAAQCKKGVTVSKSPAFMSDPFGRLAPELRTAIMDYLRSTDIASLRLVSRHFASLPRLLFRHLLLGDMPWLWEAQDQCLLPPGTTDWYSLYLSLKRKIPNPSEPTARSHRFRQSPAERMRGETAGELFKEFRGLRNRWRVWNDVTEILRRIKVIDTANEMQDT